MIRLVKNMWVSVHRKWEPVGCGPYFYVVTQDGFMSCTAFRTRADFLAWMTERGLRADGPIEEPGEIGYMRPLIGQFYEQSHMVSSDEFNKIQGLRVRQLSNGNYTLGIITIEQNGTRTVHTLNPNIKDRPVFDSTVSRHLADLGIHDTNVPDHIKPEIDALMATR